MDRLEAMEVFVATVDEGSLSKAARRRGRSIASISRAIAALEQAAGATLLRRTTRSLRLTEAGAHHLAVYRRVLAELKDVDATTHRRDEAPRGTLRVTAPSVFGAQHVRPIVDDYLARWSDVRVDLLLVDRTVRLAEDGFDVAVRIGALGDSSLLAQRLGEVRRVTCASPGYLSKHGTPRDPRDLTEHRCIANTAVSPPEHWSFGKGRDGARARVVKVAPVLTINAVEAAIGAARAGVGITLAYSYQVAAALAAGALVAVLPSWAPPPIPVHLLTLDRAPQAARVRAFVEIAVPRLRERLGSAKA
jgi:DNA-binding transcriptional LysR family regulator